MKVGSRYLRDLAVYSPVAIYKAFSQNGLKELTDEKFTELFYHTCYAKYLCGEISPSVKNLFREYMRPGCEYHVVDFSGMSVLKAVPGQNCEPAICLFKVYEGKARPVAINLRDYVVDTGDGDLWMLAKFVIMQGASNHINVAEHPKLHFPMDAINAITKTALPMNHILFQLIIPHLEITLKLNYQVLNNPTSLLVNKWWMIYAPFPATSDSLRDLTVIGYCGIKGNPAYPKYKYPMNGPRKVLSDFGTFHDEYYKAYYELAKNVLAEIPVGDKFVTQWANYIHHSMPSFPDGVEIWKNDNFVHAVAVLLWDLTLGHAADHRTYSEIPVYWNPMRMRIASPKHKDPNFKFDLTKAVTVLDQAKWIMANRLFYETWNLTNLMELDYGFKKPVLNKYVENFKKQMKEIEKNLKTRNYLPVDEIPGSIQY
jgi:hypothetical protein